MIALTGVEIFFFAWGMGFSGAVMPGPLLTVNIKESVKRGFWAGPQMVLGHALLEGALVLGLVFGLGNIITLDISKGVISLIGGVFLFWMAYGMLFKEGKEGLNLEAGEATAPSGMPPVLAGIVVSLSNPYWSIWWATLGLGFLVQARVLGAAGVLLFFLGHILADLVWYSAISLAVATGKNRLSPRLFRGLIILCGLFLIYLSLDFLRFGAETLGVFGWLRNSG